MDAEKRKAEGRRYASAIIAALFLAVLVLLICLGFGIWEEYKKAIIDNQKSQMLLTAQSLGDNLEVLIEEYEADLEGLCMLVRSGDPQIEEEQWRLFREYVDSHDRFVFDVLLESQDGTMLKSTKGHEILDTYSVTEIDGETRLHQSKLDNGKFCLILQRTVEDGRAISIIIDSKVYYDTMISNIRLGTNGYIVVKDSEGIILMHPDEDQWGIEVIEGRSLMYPDMDLTSLQEMTESQKRGEEGVAEYYSYWWTKADTPRVKKISAYSPADLGEGFLIASAVIDYDDIYIPVAEGFQKMILVFLGIIAAILAMAFYMLKLIRQKQKDTQQITYLTELNRILEEMHQSEETIAHQQRLQIMGTMTGGIAHEFNNLLTPIMGYADLLMLELPEDSELYDHASEIYEASEKAREIIQQISSLSRKNIETAYKNINAAKVLKRAFKMVQSVCPAHIHLEEEILLTDECILGNETQLNQVILNICVNAIHAIGHENGQIRIRCTTAGPEELETAGRSVPAQDWSSYIRIDIGDDGCGMSKDVLEQIFDPFFTTKKGGAGTGLGLALVEQIITSHKGFIYADSEPGKGSVFHIWLPVCEQKDQAEILEEAGGPELRLLIVDDNAKVLKLLEKNFSKLGIPVVTAMDFEDARTWLRRQAFDVLVAEQDIAGKSAVDFCMSVQGQYPGLIKIIMVDRITKEIVEAKQRGVIEQYMDKPVSDSAILKMIKSVKKDG